MPNCLEKKMEVKPYEQAKIAGRESVMEGADMRVSVPHVRTGRLYTVALS